MWLKMKQISEKKRKKKEKEKRNKIDTWFQACLASRQIESKLLDMKL